MKIRRFNESKSVIVTEDYINEILQSFKDDLWQIDISDRLIINGDMNQYFEGIYNITKLNSREIHKVTKIFCIDLTRDFIKSDESITSVSDFDNSYGFYEDLKSKMQILEQDDVSFSLDDLAIDRIEIAIDTNIEVMDVDKIEKLIELRKNGFTVDEIVDKNKVSIGIVSGNNTKFAKLYYSKITGERKQLEVDRDFEKWFNDNFRVDLVQMPDGDEDDYYRVLTIL